MNRFAYRVYYHYNGPSRSDPFREEKNSEEITEALQRFPTELPHYFSDQNASISAAPNRNDPNSILVSVATTLDETETNKAVAKCLNALDLFADKQKQAK